MKTAVALFILFLSLSAVASAAEVAPGGAGAAAGQESGGLDNDSQGGAGHEGGPGVWAHQFEFSLGVAASLFRSETLDAFDDGQLLRSEFDLRVPFFRDFGIDIDLLSTNLNPGLYFRSECDTGAVTFNVAPVLNYNESVSQQSNLTGVLFKIDFNRLFENDWHQREVRGLGFSAYTIVFPGLSTTNGIILGMAVNYTFHIFSLPNRETK